MPLIYLTTLIDAPIETCFDLARDIDVHQLSTSKTKEKAIAGKIAGLCEEGDTITWQAMHFGIKQKLTVSITKMDKPFYFEDEMQKGAFSFMKHSHRFKEEAGKTIMTDEFSFAAPFGIFGTIAEKLFLKTYMTNFLKGRNAVLKSMAELQSKQSIGSDVIVNTTKADLSDIFWLFDQAMDLQGKNGYKVWNHIDKTALEKDIENGLHYKIISGSDILCIFSIQYNDPFIWRARDQDDAIYLHRIVVNQNFKGQKQFEKVLNWARQLARQKNRKFIRMDTWADNEKIIAYYISFGFTFIEYYRTTVAPELPIQNRDLNVALLEMTL